MASAQRDAGPCCERRSRAGDPRRRLDAVARGAARLPAEAGFEVVGQAADGDELVALGVARQPDVAIDEGLRAARAIRERWPAVGILVLTQSRPS